MIFAVVAVIVVACADVLAVPVTIAVMIAVDGCKRMTMTVPDTHTYMIHANTPDWLDEATYYIHLRC